MLAGGVGGVLALGLFVWLGYGFLLWRLQEAMIFPAPGGIGVDTLDQAAHEIGAETLHLEAADGTAIYGWYKQARPGLASERSVLYFHGNGETVAASGPLMRLANNSGWDFGVIAYRGYPGSEGSPGEEGIALDARALWDHVTGKRGVEPRHIVLHGRSLGGAVAVRLASEVQPGAVVLESSFTSMVEMSRRQAPLYPVERLLRHPFDTWSRLENWALPTLIVHGSADGVVPVEHGWALASRLPSAQYVEVQGGQHNDLLVLADPAVKRAWLDLLRRTE